MFWWIPLLIMVGTTALQVLLTRRPQQNFQPSSLGDIDAPTADEGRTIPVIFGTVRLRSPNVTWFGNFNNRTSLYSEPARDEEGNQVGFRYFFSMQMALCHGPIDSIEDIIVGERSLLDAYTTLVGTMSPAFPIARPGGSEQLILLDFPNLFGGDEKEGGIGFAARGGSAFWFYFGAEDQSPCNEMTSDAGIGAAYRGLCYGYADGLYFGTSNYIKPWHYVLKRIPTPLCLDTATMDINGDANPAEIILEILTNRIWGLGRPRSRMDMSSFATAAYTLASEGMGMSLTLDDSTAADQTIGEILRHIDGVLYTDPASGLWTLKLARADYDVGDLPEFTQDDILEAPEFSRGAWQETLNEIKIQYTDREADYTPRTAQAQETANHAITQELTSETIGFKGFTTAALSQQIAIRELKVHSYPLALVKLKVNRKAWLLRLGGVFKMTWSPMGISGMVLRVTGINYGALDAGEITIDAVEDIFSVDLTGYSAPAAPGWVEVTTPPTPPESQTAIEAPFQIAGSASERIMVGAASEDANGVVAYSDEGSGYLRRNTIDFLTPSGLLTAAYDRDTDALDTVGFTVDGGTNLESLIDTDADGRDRGDCLLGFDDAGDGVITEICAWEEIEDNEDGTFTFTGIVRGVYDTIPRDHADNCRVWIIRGEAQMLLGDLYPPASMPPLSGDAGDYVGGDGGLHELAYDLPFSLSGRPRGSYTYVWFVFVRPVHFAANFAGSWGAALVDAAVEKTFTVKKNVAQTTVGTIVYHTDGTVTFTTAGGVAFDTVAGEWWTVATPSQDATLSGIMATVKGSPAG